MVSISSTHTWTLRNQSVSASGAYIWTLRDFQWD